VLTAALCVSSLVVGGGGGAAGGASQARGGGDWTRWKRICSISVFGGRGAAEALSRCCVDRCPGALADAGGPVVEAASVTGGTGCSGVAAALASPVAEAVAVAGPARDTASPEEPVERAGPERVIGTGKAK